MTDTPCEASQNTQGQASPVSAGLPWQEDGTGQAQEDEVRCPRPQGTSVAREKTNLLPPKLFVYPRELRAGFLLILLPIFPSTLLWQQRKDWEPPSLS